MKKILKRLAYKTLLLASIIGLMAYSIFETIESNDLKAQLNGTGEYSISYVHDTVGRLHDYTCKEVKPISADNDNFDDWEDKQEVSLIDFRCDKGVFMTEDDWYTVANYLNWTLPMDEQLALNIQ